MSKRSVSPRVSVVRSAAAAAARAGMGARPLAVTKAISLALMLAGCTVGPDYVRPESALTTSFEQANLGEDAAIQAESTPRLLWSSFASAELDALLDRAIAANTTVAQAAARLAETRALAGLSPYALFPTVTSNADAERSQASGSDPFGPETAGRIDTYRAGFDASWEIDLFGSLRNQSKQIYQQVDAQAADLADVRLSVVAEVAQAWLALLGARQQLALGQQQLSNLQANVDLLKTLMDAGRGTAFDVARAEVLSHSLAASVAQTQASVVRQEQRLAVLTAWPMAELRSHLDAETQLPTVPALQTVGTPSQWLLRRPDIRRAERQLAAAYSDIGYEQAQYFPILTLLGDYGWTAQQFGKLGSGAAERWSFGPSISWRFLDFGRIGQFVDAAEARADAARALYQETVLRALEDTEIALATLRAANRGAVELGSARDASDEAARLAQLRFDAGASNYLDVLDAQRSQLDLQSQALQARVDQATALVAVYKALAGDFAAAQ